MVDTKTKYFFKEWDLLSYSSIYSFFNDSYCIEKFKDEEQVIIILISIQINFGNMLIE